MKITIFQYEKLTRLDTYIYDFAKVLTKAGHFVTVVTSDQMPLIGSTGVVSRNEVVDRLVGVQWVKLKFLKLLPSLESLSLFKKILASSSVVYVKNEIFDLIPVLIANRHVKTPVVCGIHTALYYFNWKSLRAYLHNKIYSSFFYGNLLSSCNIIHALNNDDKNFLERVFDIDPSKIFVVPLWIDREKFKPLFSKKINGFFKILFLGRLDMRKGVDVLLQSIIRLSKKFPEKFCRMTFTIIGDGPLVSYVKKLQEKYHNIYYSSFFTGNRVDLYNEHNAVIVPSRGETFSYVTLEALSCGLPVIASNIPGPRSLIEDESTGILFPVCDSIALTEAILLMYDKWIQGPQYNRMRMRCRQRVSNFSSDFLINKFENLLEQAASIKQHHNSK